MNRIRVKNSDRIIEVANVYCIGKNYAEHIKEMDQGGSKSDIPEEPIVFLKPNTSIICESEVVQIPIFKELKISDNLQNEAELVVVMGYDAKDINVSDALDYVIGYCVGIDFTLRDLQSDFKQKGLPWTLSKGFWGAAPVSKMVLSSNIRDAEKLDIKLWVNGELKQSSNTSKMIFKISYLIHYISYVFGISKGDVIFTGPPAGVTKLYKGDMVKAQIEKIGELNIKVE